MRIEEVLGQLDELFAQHKADQVEAFLLGRIQEATAEQDTSSLITLINELIGHYREMGEFDKSISCCRQVLELMGQAGLKGSVAYATTLLNVANACRAAGLLRESMIYYQEVKKIYEKELAPDDFRYASLYNNMSLLFQEMGDFESACDCLERALSIVSLYSEARIEMAVTFTNLAASQLKLGPLIIWRKPFLFLRWTRIRITITAEPSPPWGRPSIWREIWKSLRGITSLP